MAILSRPFDPLKAATGNAGLKAITDALVKEIEALELADGARSNKRSAGSRQRLKLTLQALVLDLYAARKTSSQLTLGVNLNKNWYSDNQDVLPSFLKYDSIKPILTYLMDRRLAYVILARKGFHPGTGRGKNTKIRASKKLMDRMESEPDLHHNQVHTSASDDLIRLKDEKKKRIGFIQTPVHKRMYRNVVQINKALLRDWIDVELTDHEFRALQANLISNSRAEPWDDQDEDNQAIDFTRRTLYRVFNNGSFKEGGRFYGGWWQGIPSEYRPYLTINGKETIELDYSAIQPAILYARKGLDCPEDPYDVGLDVKHRLWVKKAFNSLLNARSNRYRTPKDYDKDAVGLSYKQLREQTRKAMAPIKSFFGTGEGIRLQCIDSNIAEKVLLHFSKLNVPCYPIHDSFIMHHGYEKELDEVMKEAFRKLVGKPIDVKPTRLTQDQKRSKRLHDQKAGLLSEEGLVTTDLDKLFGPSRPYSSYRRRLDEWFLMSGS